MSRLTGSEMDGEGSGKNFEILIDEAHSSQGGKTASAMSKAHGEMDEEDQINDALEKRIKSRKLLTTASYFAFTATPKNKTLDGNHQSPTRSKPPTGEPVREICTHGSEG